MNIPVTAEMQTAIRNLLDEIERQHNITIIHAVESGSRAWGFPSKNSDYDIRFIYHHQPDWYITPFERKDTIEVLGAGDLDASGWDLGKSLALLYKGNAALQEWLNAPIIYRCHPQKYSLLEAFARQEFNPAPAFYHYISLAKRKFLDDATAVNAKYFLYGLRALLCAQHIAMTRQIPPVRFSRLVLQYIPPILHTQLDDLLAQKYSGNELDMLVINNQLWQFAINLYDELQQTKITPLKHSAPDAYQDIMRSVIQRSS